MDKYELNLKIEQIKKLAAKKSYKQAAAVANEINWIKVKDWSALATVINVQEAVGDYAEARDMAILAYNRNLGGRKLVYKLTELFIKLGEFDEAEELYEEYEKMSQHDSNRYILYYDLRKAQGASDTELVGILEEYKEQELDERYMYELADLYAKTSRKEECIKLCDELALLFQDGIYVEKALGLKEQLGVKLTSVQKKIQKDAVQKRNDIEAVREALYREQKELARIQQDDIADVFNEDEGEVGEETENEEYNGEIGEYDEADEKDDDNALEYDGALGDETSAEFDSESEHDDGQTYEALENYETSAEDDEAQGIDAFESDDEPSGAKPKIPETLRELIANAKQKIENSYDRINRENEEERLEEEKQEVIRQIEERENAMEIEVEIPSYNLYDTQNIQEQLAKNLSAYLDDDDDEVNMLRPTPQESKPVEAESAINSQVPEADNKALEEEEQIEGQLSLADWLVSVKEEKYGKQNTREYSREELERMLDEKDEKSAAYEKLVAEQKRIAKEEGKELDENEAHIKARTQMMLHAAKTDLAIRTGKATLKLEEAIANLKEAAAISGGSSSVAGSVVANAVDDNATEENEVISLNTASFTPVTDEVVKKYNNKATSKAFSVVEAEESKEVEEHKVYSAQERPFESSVTKQKSLNSKINDEVKGGTLTGELAKMFRKYREMPGLEAQIAELFIDLDEEMQISTSSYGNILISGNSSSDKTDLARTIVRAINYLYPDNQKKIAKTTGDSINSRGLTKAMGKLRGTALIVEGAGTIQPKRIAEIMNCLDQETDRMIVIFEDSDREMDLLLKFNPDLVKKFNHRIVLKQYTVNELVEMARTFARKRQYEVDDDALLELYLKIDRLHTATDNIRLDDIKDIINRAIENSERRASKKFFGGIKKKRGENGDIFFLSEADFRD
ncbi:MAG: hypothetical protein J6B39_07450 [Lachnospiraceae bacterium]|nr:hypothetical protein [Lachnospiraceae bacterium]